VNLSVMGLPEAKRGSRQSQSASGRNGARPKMQLTLFLVRAQCVLLLAGSVALTYCADTLVAAKRFQADAQKQFRKSTSQVSANRAFSNAVRLPTPASPPVVAPLTAVGKLEIPAVGLLVTIAEGDAPGVFRVAVGHVPARWN
jgi:sortase (surface protein transpeptidase)